MHEISEGIEKSFNVKINLEYTHGYPALINSKKETLWLKNIAENIPSINNVVTTTPSLGGEDFAYFLKERPGCYFNTGVKNTSMQADYPHHHPKFDMDENGLLNGPKIFLALIEKMNELK